MTEMNAREFSRKTARTVWMVGIALAFFIGVQVGFIPAVIAQVVYGGVAYDVTKYLTWVVPRAYHALITAEHECPDEPLDRFGREQCICRQTGARSD